MNKAPKKTSKSKQPKWKRTISSPWPWALALLGAVVFFSIEEIINIILPYTKYYYAQGFVLNSAMPRIEQYVIDEYLAFPVAQYIAFEGMNRFLIIPYYLVLGYVLFFVHLYIKFTYKYIVLITIVVLGFLRVIPGTLRIGETDEPSVSIGSPKDGAVQHARRVPYSGDGYKTYSFWGYLAGRTFTHESVKNTMIESFSIASSENERTYILGETGLKEGGPIAFHHGKQNGMQVDVLLPLIQDSAVYEKCHIGHGWFYRTGFERENGLEEFLATYDVDFKALATHLLTIINVAPKYALKVDRIEIHKHFRQNLLKGVHGKALLQFLHFRGRKDAKDKPAYYTITFAPASSQEPGAMQNLLDKIKEKRNQWLRNDR